MDDLVTWWRAALDEDERVAKAASAGPWTTPGPDTIAEWSIYSEPRGWMVASACVNSYPDSPSPKLRGGIDGDEANANAAHIARHDPARVLREVAAKRAILDLHASDGAHECAGGADGMGAITLYEVECPTLRQLAAVFADRPGYREDWRP